MKKLFVSFLVMSLTVFYSFVPSFAYEGNVSNEKELIIGFQSDDSRTKATFYGPGGSSKLNYASGSKSLTWSIHPSNGEALNFNGTIIISQSSNGAIKRTIRLTGFGVNIGGTEGVGPLNSGTKYRADLEGVGVGVFSGNKYRIIDDAHIDFTYYS